MMVIVMKVINSASSACVASIRFNIYIMYEIGLIVQPLDVLKTRCQTVNDLSCMKEYITINIIVKYIMNDLKSTLKRSPLNLWNGSLASLSRVSLGFGIYVPLMSLVAGRDITLYKYVNIKNKC